MAIGSSITQVEVVSPLAVVSLVRTPVAAAVTVSGTVMVNSKVALSEGWLLDGNHVIAPEGSLTTKMTPPW